MEATKEHFMDKLDDLNVNSLRDAIDWIFPEVMKPQYHSQHFFDIPDEHQPVLIPTISRNLSRFSPAY